MKAISLWQPWASLWLSERKVHETRDWAPKWNRTAMGTPIPSTIAVHAAQKFVRTHIDASLLEILQDEFGGHWGMDLPTGALIGTVELLECIEIPPPLGWAKIVAGPDDFVCGDWTEGRFAWRRGAYRVFERPIPWKGAQGFFNVPDDVIREAA
jgi:hypothetical protein